jgi:hypothetical protein
MNAPAEEAFSLLYVGTPGDVIHITFLNEVLHSTIEIAWRVSEPACAYHSTYQIRFQTMEGVCVGGSALSHTENNL